MTNKELRKLVLDLAEALLDTVSDLQAAQDVFEEDSYAPEMKVYWRAMDWLKEHNEIINPEK